MGFDCQGCGERWSTVESNIPLCPSCTKSLRFFSGRIMPVPRWRTEPPTAEEIADPRIWRWMMRTYPGLPPCVVQVLTDREHHVVGGPGPDSETIASLVQRCPDTQWCPVYAPEEP